MAYTLRNTNSSGGNVLANNGANGIMLPGFTPETSAAEGQWEFTSANTQYLTHGLFPYPARMIPQIAERLISVYWPDKDQRTGLIVDMFCGSGTVLVEASLRGIPSLGIDINPFAVLLARAKTTPVEESALALAKEKLRSYLHRFSGAPVNECIPSFHNLYHWFKPAVVAQLSYLRYAIDQLEDESVQGILKIVFAHTVMRCSNVDWKSSRYIRALPESKLETHNPDVFVFFQGTLGNMENKLRAYSLKKEANAEVKQGDARCLSISDGEVDLIITSPPYGEERNTIPYIRWSRLFLLWLGFSQEEIRDLETRALGGADTQLISQSGVPSSTFWNAVTGVPEKRLREALPFMVDYLSCLREVQRVLRPGRRACIVIGHRSISRKLIDMGRVSKELAEAAGLRHETTYFRYIPKKMIPWTGPTGKTIGQESIVILAKEG